PEIGGRPDPLRYRRRLTDSRRLDPRRLDSRGLAPGNASSPLAILDLGTRLGQPRTQSRAQSTGDARERPRWHGLMHDYTAAAVTEETKPPSETTKSASEPSNAAPGQPPSGTPPSNDGGERVE